MHVVILEQVKETLGDSCTTEITAVWDKLFGVVVQEVLNASSNTETNNIC